MLRISLSRHLPLNRRFGSLLRSNALVMSDIELVISHSHLSVNECCGLLGGGLGRGVREESSKPEEG